MGRATVVSEYGEGLYRVRIRYDRSRAEAEIDRLGREEAALAARLPGLQAALAAAQSAEADATQALQDAIASQDPDAIAAAQDALLAATAEVLRAATAEREVVLRRAAVAQRISWLAGQLPPDHEVDAWCADYTLGLTGDVGTVEVARREAQIDDTSPATGYVIEPGGATGASAAYDGLRDGALVPTLSQTPEQAWLNYALLPGAVRWQPRYRGGTVTGIDAIGGTLDVDLDPVWVGHQQLPGQGPAALTAVPVAYMGTAEAGIFELGDRVLVRFGGVPPSWDDPTVVGFLHSPRLPGFGIAGPTLAYHGAQWVIHGGVAPYTAWIRLEHPTEWTPRLGLWVDYDYYAYLDNDPNAPYPGQGWGRKTVGPYTAHPEPYVGKVYPTVSGNMITLDWPADGYPTWNLSDSKVFPRTMPTLVRLYVQDAQGDQATLDLDLPLLQIPMDQPWERGSRIDLGALSGTMLEHIQGAFPGRFVVPRDNPIVYGTTRLMDTISFERQAVYGYLYNSPEDEAPAERFALEKLLRSSSGQYEATTQWPEGTVASGTYDGTELELQSGWWATSWPITRVTP